MTEMIIEIFQHTLHDTVAMLPLLFITYLILETIERKEAFAIQKQLLSLKRYGPFCGALLGLIPQCGFSVIAAGLYVEHTISLGTLLAVFISTSDEAVPVLLAYPDQASMLLSILLTKLLLALIVGYSVDIFIKNHGNLFSQTDFRLMPCKHHTQNRSILLDALTRTIKIFAFVFLISFLLTYVIHWIGEDQFASILLEKSIWQPFLATLIGFIPNCAASVMLAQLFVSGVLSYGSLIAGLSVNAGLGIMVLLKARQDKKELAVLFSILFLSAWISGTFLQMVL